MNPKKLCNPAELEDPDCKYLCGFGPIASKACARIRGTLDFVEAVRVHHRYQNSRALCIHGLGTSFKSAPIRGHLSAHPLAWQAALWDVKGIAHALTFLSSYSIFPGAWDKFLQVFAARRRASALLIDRTVVQKESAGDQECHSPTVPLRQRSFRPIPTT
jgi:hypothetical protein